MTRISFVFKKITTAYSKKNTDVFRKQKFLPVDRHMFSLWDLIQAPSRCMLNGPILCWEMEGPWERLKETQE